MISLIIPVYNKAPFLKRCLDSVAKQYKGLAEVIVVDDGSDDGSSEICDQYDESFRVVHITHGGVSKARNYGLILARGEYATFLDADDFLAKDALRVMSWATESRENVIQFGQYRLKSYEGFDERLIYPRYSPTGKYGLGFIPKYWVYVWNKIYKISFLRKHEIRFKTGMQFGEDALYNTQCIAENGGFYHAPGATVFHVLDDKNSLCRGDGLDLARIEELDSSMVELLNAEEEPEKRKWIEFAINQHRHSKLYRKLGFYKGYIGKHDVVYLVKETKENPELVYSLRSVEQNWHYRKVWFYGGCPDNLKPDGRAIVHQTALNKWDNVRNMLFQICKDDRLTEDIWIFNDDFFVLHDLGEDMPPQYNGELMPYIERIEKKQGGPDNYTTRLREAETKLKAEGLTTYNYEVHKPMLFNRKKLLEVLEKYPTTPAYRSLYGNYWKIGGENNRDRKIKIKFFSDMDRVENFWSFVSTSDTSFNEGNIGEFIRGKFANKTRFEKEDD